MKLFKLIVLTLSVLPSAALAQERRFFHPDRIRYDAQCITVDGQDTLIFSGAFHYFRCPKPLWRDRFAKLKEAGCNAVETYVAWNWHEREMPANVNDFSKVDMTDLVDWMKMAHEEFGLYTIIRPGPYICAEWAGGGFPAWLMLKKPSHITGDNWLRSDDPEFLAWSKHWLDACNKVVVPEQITRKPVGAKGVILYQIENEYDFIQGFSDEQRIRHLKALYRYSVDAGIDVPIFTCWTRQIRGSTDPDLRNVFDGPNSYPRWNLQNTARDIDRCREQQPDAPLMIPECQGGWFAQVGGVLSEQQDGVTAEQCNGISMTALAHGVTILNYYMFFGGTNFGDWGARGQTTTYDYASPIREHGGVGDKFQAVKAIGTMLKEFGPALARAQRVTATAEGFDDGVVVTVRRAVDGQLFVFCWNRSRDRKVHGEGKLSLDQAKSIAVTYALEPFAYKVLWLPAGASDSSAGRWLPEPAPQIERPAAPQPVRITQAQRAANIEPQQWTDIKTGQSLLDAGVFDSRYVTYRTRISLTEEQASKFRTLRLEQSAADSVVARVNGHNLTTSQLMRRESSIPLGSALRAGDNELVVLYEALGYPNFGAGIHHVPGIRSGALVYSKTPPRMITEWRSHLAETRRPTTQMSAEFDDSSWDGFVLDDATAAEIEQPIQPGAQVKNAAGRILNGRSNTTAVFRTRIELTQEEIDAGLTELVFERLDDQGIVYINGKEAGATSRGRWNLSIDARQYFKPGTNLVAVAVTNRDGPGGITRPVRLLGTHLERIELPWQLADSVGKPGSWTSIDLENSPVDDGAMVAWYRIEFELPSQQKDVWVPWLARLNATGNGMIWLNDQHLGRYWQVGPQRDFYLPECWLKFGPGQKNVLTLCLRRTDKPPTLTAPVEISPDANAAEKR